MDQLLAKLDKLVLFFAIYTILFLVFFGTLSYTLPFVLALIFALVLQKPTKYLIKKFKFKNSLASLITTLIFFAVIIFLLVLGITVLSNELIQLGKNIQSYISGHQTYIYDFFNTLQKYYKNLDPSILDTIEQNVSSYATKTLNVSLDLTSKLVSGVIGFAAAIPYLLMVILFTLLTTYFFTKDIASTKGRIDHMIPIKNSARIHYIFKEMKRMLGNYLLSYLLIISITFIETLIVFLIFRVKYAVILSILCGVLDLLPIFGIGAIYIPLIIIYLLSHNYIAGIGLLVFYLIITIVRQIIEPKIVSSSLGIHPVAVLASIFVGLKANGFSGMVFCIFLVVFYNIFRKVDVL